MSEHPTRRGFLKQSSAAATGLAIASLGAPRAAGASGRFTVAVIGPGGMGTNLMNSFAAMKDVDVAYVCDIDSSRADKAASGVEKISGKKPKAVADLRRILDDPAVDAVIIGIPDHWHAPATILACDAGKHVYVEKPASHNIREGRLMIDAARRHKRIVQVGMQSRSAPHVKRAIELVRSGAIGDVLSVKIWNSQLRGNIGRLAAEHNFPEYVDPWTGAAHGTRSFSWQCGHIASAGMERLLLHGSPRFGDRQIQALNAASSPLLPPAQLI